MRKITTAGWQQIAEQLESECRRRKGIAGAVIGAAMGVARAMALAADDRPGPALILSAAAVGLAYGAADLGRLGPE